MQRTGWLTAPLEQLRRAQLVLLLDDMDDVPTPVRNSTVPAIIKWIRDRRTAYWDNPTANKGQVVPRPSILTATECNAELASRPPLPLWGEE